MKKHLPFIILSLILVASIFAAGCISEDTTSTTEKKWLYSNIIGEVTPDTNVSLVDDYHAAVNKEWLSTAQIPEGNMINTAFYELEENNKAKLIELIKDETITSHDADLIRTYYNAYLDWDKRNKDGLKPLEDEIKPIESIKTLDDYKKYIAEEKTFKLLPASSDTNPFDSSEYILGLNYVSLSLGDSAEYAALTSSGKLRKEANEEFVKKMLLRLGYTQEQADKIVEDNWWFESQLAPVTKTTFQKANLGDYLKGSKVYTIEELKKIAPNLPIEEALSGYIKNGVNNILVIEPEVLQKLNELYTQENLDKIKAFFIYNTILNTSSYLDRETQKLHDERFSKIYGIKYTSDTEDDAYNSLLELLKKPVDKIFVENAVDPKTKEDVIAMIHSAIDIYRERLTKATWLSEETRKKAIEKLDAITIQAIGPDDWSDPTYDYSSLSLDDCDSLLEMVNKIDDFNKEKDYSIPGTKVDKNTWNASMSTVDTNASYYPLNNSMVIFAGITQPPIYDASASIEENYGGLYTIIAHEISHAFDSSGSQFDKDGNMNNWWTDEDKEKFEEKTQKVADYFSTIEVAPDTYVDGNLTVTEAVADLGGLSVALEAASKIENFDYDKFFKSYALHWKTLMNQDTQKHLVLSSSHPPGNVRTNAVVQQFEEFHKTYNVKPGDGMYLAPEKRIAIW